MLQGLNLTSTSDTDQGADAALPQTATHPLAYVAGLAAFFAALAVVLLFGLAGDPEKVVYGALIVLLLIASAMSFAEIVLLRVYERPTSGVDFSRFRPNLARAGVKIAGLIGSYLFIFLAYFVFREFHKNEYYFFYYMLLIAAKPWIVATALYFFIVDAFMTEPRDGYWHLGMALLGKFRVVDRAKLLQHMLGWTIKGFFIPLMFISICGWMGRIAHVELRSVKDLYTLALALLFLIDVSFGTAGYIFSLRVLDTHLRSAEPNLSGWVPALICYVPFGTILAANLWDSSAERWGDCLADNALLHLAWGSAIVVLTAIYTWATVVFGLRMSNLTNRGLITSGPYRWTKHPAYISKNLSWWLVSVPFLGDFLSAESIRNCIALLLVNFIYYLRAKTEENHMSGDPDYLVYTAWIAEHGLFARVKRDFGRWWDAARSNWRNRRAPPKAP